MEHDDLRNYRPTNRDAEDFFEGLCELDDFKPLGVALDALVRAMVAPLADALEGSRTPETDAAAILRETPNELLDRFHHTHEDPLCQDPQCHPYGAFQSACLTAVQRVRKTPDDETTREFSGAVLQRVSEDDVANEVIDRFLLRGYDVLTDGADAYATKTIEDWRAAILDQVIQDGPTLVGPQRTTGDALILATVDRLLIAIDAEEAARAAHASPQP